MKEFVYKIEDPNGMHARPAGKLATFAKQFDSEVRVRCDGKDADAKRLLALMSLGAQSGAELHFYITGTDEEEACHSLEKYCARSWGSGTGA